MRLVEQHELIDVLDPGGIIWLRLLGGRSQDGQ
jgi:hypothetical protein